MRCSRSRNRSDATRPNSRARIRWNIVADGSPVRDSHCRLNLSRRSRNHRVVSGGAAVCFGIFVLCPSRFYMTRIVGMKCSPTQDVASLGRGHGRFTLHFRIDPIDKNDAGPETIGPGGMSGIRESAWPDNRQRRSGSPGCPPESKRCGRCGHNTSPHAPATHLASPSTGKPDPSRVSGRWLPYRISTTTSRPANSIALIQATSERNLAGRYTTESHHCLLWGRMFGALRGSKRLTGIQAFRLGRSFGTPFQAVW